MLDVYGACALVALVELITWGNTAVPSNWNAGLVIGLAVYLHYVCMGSRGE